MPSNGFKWVIFFHFEVASQKYPIFNDAAMDILVHVDFSSFWDEFLGGIPSEWSSGEKGRMLVGLLIRAAKLLFQSALLQCHSKCGLHTAPLPIHRPFVAHTLWDKRLVSQCVLIYRFPPLESLNSLKAVMSAEPPACLVMWLIVIAAPWDALLWSILHS